MTDLLYPDFKTKTRNYTKTTIDTPKPGADLGSMAMDSMNMCFPFAHHDTAPSEYVAPEKDPA